MIRSDDLDFSWIDKFSMFWMKCGQDEFIYSFIHNFILYDFFKIPPNVSSKYEFGIYLILADWEQVAFCITEPTSPRYW